MKRWLAGLLVVAACTAPQPAAPPAIHAGQPAATLEQGWTPADREVAYTTSQGSQLIPASWFAALRRSDAAEPFGADRLARYGYLPNGSADLPVGFVVDQRSGALGMTCAACHTGAIQYKGQTWRIDGGRANADFQRFLTDLTQAARDTTLQPDRFAAFALAVQGPAAAQADHDQLAADLRSWTDRFGTFMDKSLPAQPWGPGRLDAFGMIFNRVTALDLQDARNYRTADAPVRYPFLWNAAAQDRTQWDGAAPNGEYVKALARNTGEVFGVFGVFKPHRVGLIVAYDNEVRFDNLQTLEAKLVALRPPPWPRAVFGLDDAKVARGAVLFDSACASCHAAQPSKAVRGRWATPVCSVGTDPVMHDNAAARGQSGVLAGTPQIQGGGFLQREDAKLSILANAVIGSILHPPPLDTGLIRAVNADLADRLRPAQAGIAASGARWTLPADCIAPPQPPRAPVAATAGTRAVVAAETAGLYQLPQSGPGPAPDQAAYEARVLNGIWAAAPYLHNGAVPTLWQLLTPAKDRRQPFTPGLQEFDPVDVGLAAALPSAPVFDVSARGNGNGGHDYGTALPEADRRALLEYLKSL